MKDRVIFVGDIHGCLEEFEELLIKLNYNKQNDRLILLGDFVDRGPNSIEVLRKVKEMGVECVRGNHDNKILKWHNSNKQNYQDKHAHYYNQLTDDDIEFIFKMPVYIELDDVIAVHAGLKKSKHISEQNKNDLMHLRYMDKDGKFVSLRTIFKIGQEAAGAHFWTEWGPFKKSIVYGHNVNSLQDIRIDDYDDGTACYGIDTGCCFGGKLTALIWNTKEIIQVDAKKEYYQLGFV